MCDLRDVVLIYTIYTCTSASVVVTHDEKKRHVKNGRRPFDAVEAPLSSTVRVFVLIKVSFFRPLAGAVGTATT